MARPGHQQFGKTSVIILAMTVSHHLNLESFFIGTGTGTGMGQEPVPNPPLFNASSNASITFDFIISPINFTGCGCAMARPYKHPHNAQMLSVLPIKGTPPPRIMFTIFKERALCCDRNATCSLLQCECNGNSKFNIHKFKIMMCLPLPVQFCDSKK